MDSVVCSRPSSSATARCGATCDPAVCWRCALHCDAVRRASNPCGMTTLASAGAGPAAALRPRYGCKPESLLVSNWRDTSTSCTLGPFGSCCTVALSAGPAKCSGPGLGLWRALTVPLPIRRQAGVPYGGKLAGNPSVARGRRAVRRPEHDQVMAGVLNLMTSPCIVDLDIAP